MPIIYQIDYERTAPPYSVTEVCHTQEQVIERLCRISRIDCLAYDVEVTRQEVDERGFPAPQAMRRALEVKGPLDWNGAAREEDTEPPQRTAPRAGARE